MPVNWTELMKAVMKANEHCVKSVQMRSFLWSVFSHTRAEYGDLRSTGKYGPEKTPYSDTFRTVETGNFSFLNLNNVACFS